MNDNLPKLLKIAKGAMWLREVLGFELAFLDDIQKFYDPQMNRYNLIVTKELVDEVKKQKTKALADFDKLVVCGLR